MAERHANLPALISSAPKGERDAIPGVQPRATPGVNPAVACWGPLRSRGMPAARELAERYRAKVAELRVKRRRGIAGAAAA
eukprot:5620958-Alexandrium_andersonii.AAC.1